LNLLTAKRSTSRIVFSSTGAALSIAATRLER
jgi:hypothetical protein